MNWFKHILIVVALLAGALPCVHAGEHSGHDHRDDRDQLCQSYACLCHSGEPHSHEDHIDIEQRSVPVAVTAAAPASVHTILYTHTETRSTLRRIILPVTTPLSALKTVQLLT